MLLLLTLLACAGDKPSESATGCLACPDLLGRPCNKGADTSVDYYHCDPCGAAWRCTLTGTETRDFLYWSAADIGCACITPEGFRDSTDPACGEAIAP